MKPHAIALALAAALPIAAAAQQVPAPKSAADVTAPADGVTMNPEYARSVAKSAYIWGWPMVNQMNRKAKITQAPHPGLLNGILPAAPRGQIGMLHNYIEPSETFVACPNQDVVYGLGFFSLNEEPVIAQVPDFGDRFWVYALYDQRTDQFTGNRATLTRALYLDAWKTPAAEGGSHAKIETSGCPNDRGVSLSAYGLTLIPESPS